MPVETDQRLLLFLPKFDGERSRAIPGKHQRPAAQAAASERLSSSFPSPHDGAPPPCHGFIIVEAAFCGRSSFDHGARRQHLPSAFFDFRIIIFGAEIYRSGDRQQLIEKAKSRQAVPVP